jgi:hypothetical protein
MMPVEAVVLDIEGTTTSVAFATDVLYPYARERLPNYIRQHRNEPEVAGIMDEAREAGSVWNDEAVVVRMCHWMERDQKVTPLKDVQGLIWEEGYRNGELLTPLYPDVAPELARAGATALHLLVGIGPRPAADLRPHRRRRPDAAAVRLFRHPHRTQTGGRLLSAHRRDHRRPSPAHPVPVGHARRARRRPGGGVADGLDGARGTRWAGRSPPAGHALRPDTPLIAQCTTSTPRQTAI